MKWSKVCWVALAAIVVLGGLWYQFGRNAKPVVTTKSPTEIAVVVAPGRVFPDHLALQVGVDYRIDLLSLAGDTSLSGLEGDHTLRWGLKDHVMTSVTYTPPGRDTVVLTAPGGGSLELRDVTNQPPAANEVALIAHDGVVTPTKAAAGAGKVQIGLAALGQAAALKVGQATLSADTGTLQTAEFSLTAGTATAALSNGHGAQLSLVAPQTAVVAGADIFQRAVGFTLPTPHRKQVSLSDYRGRPVVLGFWAGWSEDSRTQVQTMESVAAAHPGLSVLEVSIGGETPARVNQWGQSLGLDKVTLLVDTDSAMSAAYDAHRLPTTIFIDANGIIRARFDNILSPELMKRFLQEIGVD